MVNQELISDLEARLRRGDTAGVLDQLGRSDIFQTPENLKVDMAGLLRRVGRPEKGLLLLGHESHDDFFSDKSDSIIEYCMCLKEIGAVFDAQLLLSRWSGPLSEAHYICEINLAFVQSDFFRVIEGADGFLASFDKTSYNGAIVRVNRLAALVALGRLAEVEEELVALKNELAGKKWYRLLMNCEELAAQWAIRKGDHQSAKDFLENAKKLAISDGQKDHLFIKRWDAVIRARETKNTEPLKALKVAVGGHYETLRALDFEILKVDFSEELFHHLYFGTFFPEYRKMLEAEFGAPENRYVIHPEAEEKLSLLTGTWCGKESLPAGGKVHLLLSSLMSDFYRPIRVGTLFSLVFFDEVFDPRHSVNKVHQLIFRARKWLSENEVPLVIEEIDKAYILKFERPVSVEIGKSPPKSRSDFQLERLRLAFQREFGAAEAEKLLSSTSSSTNRLLARGLEKQMLERKGFGKKTRYIFKPQEPDH